MRRPKFASPVPDNNGHGTSARAPSPVVHVIDPNAAYTLETARAALGLPATCLRREVRLGRLRVSKRSGRYYILGEWILEWIREGEIKRRL
jgi:hypothetical protein